MCMYLYLYLHVSPSLCKRRCWYPYYSASINKEYCKEEEERAYCGQCTPISLQTNKQFYLFINGLPSLIWISLIHCYKTWWEIPSSTPGAAGPKHQADGTGFWYGWYEYSVNSISYIGMFRQKFHYIGFFCYHFDANNVKFRQLSARSEFSDLFPMVSTRYSAKITDIISNNRHAIL